MICVTHWSFERRSFVTRSLNLARKNLDQIVVVSFPPFFLSLLFFLSFLSFLLSFPPTIFFQHFFPSFLSFLPYLSFISFFSSFSFFPSFLIFLYVTLNANAKEIVTLNVVHDHSLWLNMTKIFTLNAKGRAKYNFFHCFFPFFLSFLFFPSFLSFLLSFPPSFFLFLLPFSILSFFSSCLPSFSLFCLKTCHFFWHLSRICSLGRWGAKYNFFYHFFLSFLSFLLVLSFPPSFLSLLLFFLYIT